jgi:hypothetical protein
MRIILLLLICFPVPAFSQSDFAKQVKAIIADSSNRFLRFKGAFDKIIDSDSIYLSSITLEGTTKNDISISDKTSMYFTWIADSVKEKQGKRIVAEWRDKILNILGSKFKEKKIEIVSYNPAVDGWMYTCGNLSIDIALFPQRTSSRYMASLAFTYSAGN